MQPKFLWSVLIVAISLSYWASTSGQARQLRVFGSVTSVGSADDAASNVSIGDVDGDRDLDLIIVKGRHQAGGLQLLLNDGRGRFTSTEIATTPDNSYAAPFIDVDGDGHLDV